MERENQLVENAIRKLEEVRSKPVMELESGLHEAQQRLIAVRDQLIEKIRGGNRDPSLQSSLGQANAALSLIFGLEFPLSGFQRKKIQQAEEALKGML
ncbi:MAG TPA: hypothetical protein VF790_00865 [Dissulfurispiraceae bacterium]